MDFPTLSTAAPPHARKARPPPSSSTPSTSSSKSGSQSSSNSSMASKGSTRPDNATNQQSSSPQSSDDMLSCEHIIAPSPVSPPDEEQYRSKVEGIERRIKEKEDKIAALTQEVERLKQVRSERDGRNKSLRSQLQDAKAQIRKMTVEKDTLLDEAKEAAETAKAQEAAAESMMHALARTDLSVIEEEMKQITTKLEKGEVDLRTERLMIQGLKDLATEKHDVMQWMESKKSVGELSQRHDDLLAERKQKMEEINELREKEKDLQNQLDKGAPSIAGECGNVNGKINDVLQDKAFLVEALKLDRQELKDATIRHKVKLAEYREYQKITSAYERKVERQEMLKRKQQQAALSRQYKEEKKEREKMMEKRHLAVACGCQLFVGGLSFRCSEERLAEEFSHYGRVTDAFVVRDNETKSSRGFAFVTLANAEQANAAVDRLNGTDVPSIGAKQGLTVKLADKSKQQLDWEERHSELIEKHKEEQEAAGPEPAFNIPNGVNGSTSHQATAKEVESDVEPNFALAVEVNGAPKSSEWKKALLSSSSKNRQPTGEA